MHVVAVAAEVAADELADRRLVLDQENVPGHRAGLHQLDPACEPGQPSTGLIQRRRQSDRRPTEAHAPPWAAA